MIMLIGVLVGAACGSPDPSLSNRPGQNPGDSSKPPGEILYVSGGNVYRWDGSLHQITKDGHAASPRWSPDAQRFVYVELNDLAYSDLVIADRSGNVVKHLTQNRPDGQPGTHDWVANAYWAMDPTWSPAGEQIAYTSDRGGTEYGPGEERYSDPMNVWYVEKLSIPPYILPAATRLAGTEEWPTFSPDGNLIAVEVRSKTGVTGARTDLWTINLSTGETTKLAAGDGSVYQPAWSPDGKNIAYIQRSGDQNDVWILPVDGGKPYKLTSIGSCAAPVWSPDGKFLAFFKQSDPVSFEADYVQLTAGAAGKLTASSPQKLFSADDIDVPSGMSWGK